MYLLSDRLSETRSAWSEEVKSGAASSQRLPAERPIYGTQKLFARSRPTSAPRAPSDVPRRDRNVRLTSTPAVRRVGASPQVSKSTSGDTGVSDCALGSTARDISGSNPSRSHQEVHAEPTRFRTNSSRSRTWLGQRALCVFSGSHSSTEGGSKNPVSRSIVRKLLIKKTLPTLRESMIDSSVAAGPALSPTGC